MIYSGMSTVLSDFISAFYVCLQNHGISIPMENLTKLCENFFNKEEPPECEDSLTIFERRIQAFCVDLEASIEVADIRDIATTVINTVQQHHYLDPDCCPVLKALRQNKILALISNFDHPPHVYTLVSKLGLEEFFTAVIVSGEVGIKKPDPGIFHLALQRTGLQPEEVIYVGDAEEDIKGSLAAGIAPILIQREQAVQNSLAIDFTVSHRPVQTKPDVINITGFRTITRLPELIDMLQ